MQYRKNFRSGNFFTHVSAAFASRFLIRMTSLVPEMVDARRIGKDVEQLAGMLNQVPGFQFASLLRDVIRRARRNKVLPPPSKPSSPTRGTLALPTMWPSPRASSAASQGSASQNAQNPDGTTFPFDQPEVGVPQLDFLYAEQLFNSGRTGETPNPLGYSSDRPPETSNMFVDQNYNFDMWFPFPPLENDVVSTHSASSVPPGTQHQSPGSAPFFSTTPGSSQPAPGSQAQRGSWW